MGTRSITEVRSRWEDDDEWEVYARIYRHWDGYLNGHGKWLHEFLDGLEVTNGIPANPQQKLANEPGRLAAQMVYQLQKDGHEPDLLSNPKPVGQNYHYVVDVCFSMDGGSILVAVFEGPVIFFGGGGDSCNKKIFCGDVKQFGNFINMLEA